MLAENLGFEYGASPGHSCPVVTRLDDRGPAEEAGVELGDEIVAVDGMSMEEGDVLSLLSTSPGEKVQLFLRQGGGCDTHSSTSSVLTREVTIVRRLPQSTSFLGNVARFFGARAPSPPHSRPQPSLETTPHQRQQERATSHGHERCGVGMGIALVQGVGHIVTELVPGGAAERSSGLLPGDVIIKVDETEVHEGMTRAELRSLILGSSATEVVVKVQRGDAVLRVPLTRSAADSPDSRRRLAAPLPQPQQNPLLGEGLDGGRLRSSHSSWGGFRSAGASWGLPRGGVRFSMWPWSTQPGGGGGGVLAESGEQRGVDGAHELAHGSGVAGWRGPLRYRAGGNGGGLGDGGRYGYRPDQVVVSDEEALRFAYLRSLDEARAAGMQQGSGWRQGGGGGEGGGGARDASGVGGEVGTLLGDEGGFVERWRQISHEEREGLVDMASRVHGVRISVREFEDLLNANPAIASRLSASMRDGGEGDMDYEHLVELQDVAVGPSEEQLSTLPTTTHSEGGGGDCSICLCGVESGEVSVRLPCLHSFHRDCAFRWLARSRLCPVCKNDVALDESGVVEVGLEDNQESDQATD